MDSQLGFIYVYIIYIYVSTPSEKYQVVSWDDEIPNWMEHHKIPWFQTTNQIWLSKMIVRDGNIATEYEIRPIKIEFRRLILIYSNIITIFNVRYCSWIQLLLSCSPFLVLNFEAIPCPSKTKSGRTSNGPSRSWPQWKAIEGQNRKKSMSYGTVIFHSYVKFYVKLEEANYDLMISYDYIWLWSSTMDLMIIYPYGYCKWSY